jgi:glucokinase
MTEQWLLTGDIGGTKTTLALYPLAKSSEAAATVTVPSREYATFEDALSAFFSEHPVSPERAVIAVAGPVLGRGAHVTNLPWEIDAASIEARFNIPRVDLLNDIEALGWAVPDLYGDRLHVLHTGQPREHGPIAILAPGTGCGEAFLIWNGRRYIPQPTEAGHADYAPSTQDHAELLRFLRESMEQVSVESVCSGLGLPNIYRFLRDERGYSEESWLAEALRAGHDPTPTISAAALEGRSELCIETLRWFVDLLAAEARCFALRILATGGVFLGGGIPRRILPLLSEGRFVEVFHRDGPVSNVLREIPISVILAPHAALDGAAISGQLDVS